MLEYKTFCLLLLSLMIFVTLTSPLAFGGEVMIIGDSLSVGTPWDDKNNTRSGLGRELGKLLEKEGHNVSVVASCGSSPLSYISKYKSYNTPCGYYQKYAGAEKIDRPKSETPKLKDIFAKKKSPDLMVIQQGTNLYWAIQNGSSKYVEDKVAELLIEYKASAPQSKCLWVGPPAIIRINNKAVTKEQTDQMANAINAGIAKSGVDCDYVDSRLHTSQSGLSSDGTHFKTGNIDEWINQTFDVTRKMLSVPNAATDEMNGDCEINKSSIDNFLEDFSKIKNRIK